MKDYTESENETIFYTRFLPVRERLSGTRMSANVDAFAL